MVETVGVSPLTFQVTNFIVLAIHILFLFSVFVVNFISILFPRPFWVLKVTSNFYESWLLAQPTYWQGPDFLLECPTFSRNYVTHAFMDVEVIPTESWLCSGGISQDFIEYAYSVSHTHPRPYFQPLAGSEPWMSTKKEETQILAQRMKFLRLHKTRCKKQSWISLM